MKFRLFTIPNLFTCLNLICGCLTIERAFSGDFLWAFGFTVLAAVMDFLDGFLARLLRSDSAVGKELDSLADVVSFGTAPSFVLFAALREAGFMGWEPYLVFMVAAFSALRLAKFNLDIRQTNDFIGLNTPANALFLISLVYLIDSEQTGLLFLFFYSPWILIGIAAILSFLLISEIPMFSFKFKSARWKDNQLRYGFLAVSLVLCLLFKLYAVPCILLLYLLVSLVRNSVRSGKREVKE